MPEKISATRDYSKLKLYINGLLHLQIPIKGHAGFQSWADEHKYCIEFYRENGKEILVEYDSKQKWIAVLKTLDKYL